MTGPAPRVRLDFLDALRGLAALYVVVYHASLIPEPDLVLPRWGQMVALNGGMGVTLFFVVSAFSLFFTMPLRLREPHPWTSFFIHRFFRIAPLFYLWIVLTLVRDRLMFGATHGFAEIAASVAFVFNLVPKGQEGFVWAGWTIGIEMLFYAVFPLFYRGARNSWQAISMTIGLLLGWTAITGLVAYFPSEPTTRDMFLKYTFLRHLPVFACGGLAFHLLLRDGQIINRSRDFGVALLAMAVLVYTALLNGWLPAVFGDQYYWQAVACVLLLLGLGWAPVRVAVNALTTYLGRISYSLYLNHPTLILLMSPLYPAIYRQGFGLTLSFLACLLSTLAVALAVSEVTYRLVELPGMRLGKSAIILLRQKSGTADSQKKSPGA